MDSMMAYGSNYYHSPNWVDSEGYTRSRDSSGNVVIYYQGNWMYLSAFDVIRAQEKLAAYTRVIS